MLLVALIALTAIVLLSVRALNSRSADVAAGNASRATDAPTAQPDIDPAATGIAEGDQALVDNLEDEEVSQPVADSEKVNIADSDLSITEGLAAEWQNILLLGQDTRSDDYYGRTDTMIIASINTSTGQIRMCSVMRDTEVNIEGVGMSRINAAHRYGGPNLIMKTINQALGMNISRYVSVNFASFPFIIEKLGGIAIDVREEELPYINQGVGNGIFMGQVNNLDETELNDAFLTASGPGTVLTGRQALAYARIRHLDSDYMRTARQRNVLNAVLQKVKDTKDPNQLMQIGATLLPYVQTNMNLMDMVGLAMPVLQNGVGDIAEMRLPVDDSFVSDNRDGVQAFYDVDLELNRQRLYEFIYG
ncbi:MAG: LCP family protein [Clostridiales bacterium]|nr:LCP family protein [Clostridiales bacterium]